MLEHVTLRHELHLSLTLDCLERSRSVYVLLCLFSAIESVFVVTNKKNEHKCVCSLQKGTSVWSFTELVLIDRDTCVCLLASLRKRL